MTTLAADVKRQYGLNVDPMYNDLPVIATDIIYEGAAVGDSGGGGTCRPLVAADVFLGFAAARADNSAGAASAINVRVRERGTVVLTVTGVTGATDVGSDVYADDDNSFTLTSSSNTAIGTVRRHISGTSVEVAFEANQVRSI